MAPATLRHNESFGQHFCTEFFSEATSRGISSNIEGSESAGFLNRQRKAPVGKIFAAQKE
jgi:hypothetical protein